MAISKLILNGDVQMDVTSDTVSANRMLNGYTATKNDGTKVTGNIATKSAADMTASGSTVTAAAGYYATATSKNVGAGSAFTPAVTITKNPTISLTSSTGAVTASYAGSSSVTPTVTAGYVAAGTAGTVSTSGTSTYQLTSKAAATYNTSTADQTVASYRWLTGTQTIKSVTTSNLTAANIASGVTVKVGDANNASRITQVTGTYAPAVSSVTVTPTETAQTFNATGVYGYKPVTVNAISSTYVGTGVDRRDGENTTFTDSTGAFYGPSGYYTEAFTRMITTQAAQTIYPSTADQTIASYRWLTGTQTIKSVTTTNLTAANIASGVVVKVGDTANASRITQITGTYETVESATVTIQGTGSANNVYVKYNNVQHYTDGESFEVPIGASIQVRASGRDYAEIDYEGVKTKSGTSISETWTVNKDITIKLYYDTYNGTVEGFPSVIPLNTYSITSNGWYNTYDKYKVSVSVGGGEGFTVDQIAMRTISGSISGNATNIGSYAFGCCLSLTSVNFPSATRINDSAFTHCSSLTSVSFPSATSIGSYAFDFCYSLISVSFPLVVSIGNSAFAYCRDLTSVNFPSATRINDYAFTYCSSLTSVSFPLAVLISSYAFSNCRGLTSVSFPLVASIGGYAFAYCYSLTFVSFPSATFIDNFAFRNCYHLLSVYLMGSSVPTLFKSNVFSSTPISNYTTSTGGVYGSIFVPASLYNSYITTTNWSVYSARLVSV